jgi:hypothetical protein
MYGINSMLYSLFKETEISPEINSCNDRKRLQKTVYLASTIGINLGFKFKWAQFGPYSKDLSTICESLNANIQAGNYPSLLPSSLNFPADKIQTLKLFLNLPENLSISQEDWLELLSSILYMSKNNTSFCDIYSLICQKRKPLAPFYQQAIQLLEINNLIIPG